MKTTMSRRSFLGGAAALTIAAGADVAGAVESRGTFNLPARGEFVIRSGYVMTMDPTLGDIARGDVHVKNGAIVAVGAGLKAGGADAIDGRDMIVLPGFVDTHWHMWNTLLRSMAGDKRELGYFPTVATLGKLFTPGDMYQGESAQGIRAARPILVRDAAGSSRDRDDRSRRPRTATAGVEEPLERGPARPRAGLARHGRRAGRDPARGL
ncbi:MAG: hypothetical protein DME03_23260, partial [Candidatus Rokuibacteriota bacterium]